MNIYDEKGYLSFVELAKDGYPFNIVVGGRGTGKTYGALKYYLELGKPVIYMRRTQMQIDIASNVNYTPYKTVTRDMGIEYTVSSDKPKVLLVNEKPMAYMLALSTFSNIRGFDGSDCDAIIYDEFIPERQERPIRNEPAALYNAYETINRNRELSGECPLTLWCLANSNRIDSPLLEDLGLIDRLEKMESSGIERWIDNDRGIQVVRLSRSAISERKKDTALYKMLRNSEYVKMSLQNEFVLKVDRVSSKDLKNYTPTAVLGDVCFYISKQDGTLYLSTHKAGKIPTYLEEASEIKRFCARYPNIFQLFNIGLYSAESRSVVVKAERMLNSM